MILLYLDSLLKVCDGIVSPLLVTTNHPQQIHPSSSTRNKGQILLCDLIGMDIFERK
jgi:hypothetical protein